MHITKQTFVHRKGGNCSADPAKRPAEQKITMNVRKIIRKVLVTTVAVLAAVLLFVCAPAHKASASPKKVSVLFIGNSLTRRHNNYFVDYFKKLCKAGGNKVTVAECTYTGCTFSKFANRSCAQGRKAYRMINSRKWDYVVLQENTDWITGRYSVTRKNAKILVGWIKKKNPAAKLVYNATWAYKRGRRIDGVSYSYSRNQNTLNKNYQRLQKEFGGIISYSGNAFRKYKSKYASPNLWLADNNHPSKDGAYLSACTMYATLFGSPEGLKYYGNSGKTVAKRMQKIVAEAGK